MTICFLADENFNRRILAGLSRRVVDLDVVGVQDVGLLGADDPSVLQWAAVQDSVLLTHDVATVPKFALERISSRQTMSGVLVVPSVLAIGDAIDDPTLVAEMSLPGEWDGQIRYLPLQ